METASGDQRHLSVIRLNSAALSSPVKTLKPKEIEIDFKPFQMGQEFESSSVSNYQSFYYYLGNLTIINLELEDFADKQKMQSLEW